jgi:carboxypeptidase family protein/TonB-dependent receptor-like protein
MKPIFHSVDSATKNLFSRGCARLLLGFFSAFVLFSLLAAPHEALAQAQAANGVIEGTVTDASGAVVPNAKVKVVNLDTGLEREETTNEKGLYRVQILPVGNYQLTVTQAGFNAFVQSGIKLSAGEAATVDVALKTGAVNSAVSIVADSPIADVSRVELGRTINEYEVKYLPLPSRNPYNFGLLQPGVNGFENVEFGVPRFNANGYKSRINYQLDGNTNTQKDRAGLRLTPISEVFVREVQVVSNGFAPEFGQTSGVVYNAITPSGTNKFHGAAGYFFRREPFVARPFFSRTDLRKADPGLDNVIASLGGPLVKDRAHFYVGYERVDRELQQDRVVSVTPANAAALGLQPPPGFIPASQLTNFFIVRPDWKINANQELFGRYTLFTNNSPNNIGGGFNTLDRSIDFKDNIQTGNAQLISILSPKLLNEFRFQYSRRNQPSVLNDLSGQGPSITIPSVAQFGAPAATDGPLLFNERITQFLDNVTWNTGAHSLKFGGDVQIVRDRREVALVSTYTFPDVASYLDARNGTNPRRYSVFTQIVGEPKIEFGSQYYFLFAQDDWRVRPNFKLNFGLRYELYDTPDARANAPLAISQKFNRDTNNFAPRLGLSYSFGDTRKTVVRASAGVFYDSPGLAFYQNAIQNNGDPLTRTFTLGPNDTGAPAFPNQVNLTGVAQPVVSIDALAPDFANLYSFNQNLQVEQEITRDFSVTAGYIHVAGNRIPVVRITNLRPISGTLADGRAIFGTGARPNPNFGNINVTESVGRSSYHAGSLSLNKRFSKGYQLSASYNWSHGIDDAPEINVIDSTEFPSDPTNRRRDRGNSLADQRHTFILSSVLNPKFDVSNRIANALANNNQFGVIARFNSGFRFNVRGNRDLNSDGVPTNDRPLFIGRNTATSGPVKQIDLRYSRFIPVRESMRVEVIGEFTNIFNIVNVSGVNQAVMVDAAGNPILTGTNILTTSNEKLIATGGFPQRIFQLGFKFHF